MVGDTEALRFIKRDAERTLVDTACELRIGTMTAYLKQILWHANNALDLYEWCWASTKPNAIAEVVRTEAEELLGCTVTVECIGDEDIGYELISKKGNFCFAVRLEGPMWRVYSLPIGKYNRPLKNVKELVSRN